MSSIGILKRRIVQVVVAILLATMLVSYVPLRANVSADTTAVVINVSTQLNIRSGPSTSSSIVGVLYPGQRVTVLDTSNAGWYKIKYGTTVGYCSSDYLQIETTSSGGSGPIGDESFENSIAAFPDSYKGRLRALHQAHPNWRFVAENYGDWNSALSLETRSGVSLVPLTSDRSWLDLNDRGVVDSPNWVNASDAIVAYYMDPRNMLTDTYVFQFMDLNYSETDGVKITETNIMNALNGTFMAGTAPNYTIAEGGRLAPYQAFAIAAQDHGINPIFLLTHVIQECGVNGSSSSNGSSGYYNFYNIGAYSNVINASRVGLSFARYGLDAAFNARYNLPWNTPGKSIVYGAKWIKDYYVSKGQNTLYAMRFNLSTTGSYTRGSHQYMTALQSCASESARMSQSYSRSGIMNSTIVFRIPVYTNMPPNPCAAPAALGVTGYPPATPPPTATPTPTPTPNKTYCEDFVARLYQYALGRTPARTGTGFVYWVNQLMNGSTGLRVSVGFLTSRELEAMNLSDEEYVRLLYRVYFNRQPDNGGFNYWVSELKNGHRTRRTIINAFAASKEFQNLCSAGGIRPY